MIMSKKGYNSSQSIWYQLHNIKVWLNCKPKQGQTLYIIIILIYINIIKQGKVTNIKNGLKSKNENNNIDSKEKIKK